MARATTPPLLSWPPMHSPFRSTACASNPATPGSRPSTSWAPAGAGPRPLRAARCWVRSPRCARRSCASPPICWRRHPTISNWPTGAVSVRGVPATRRTLGEIAAFAYRGRGRLPPGSATGIEATFDYAIPDGGWSQATHCCWVRIDLDTGLVTIDRYLVVEDCGALINPAIVDGQIAGGVAQGIGGVLYERAEYDDQAQLLTSTFADYLLPTSAEIPTIEIHHLESPPQGPVDFRGVGEGGAIGAPAALCNAIADALLPFGVEILEQHLPPTRILELAGVIAPAGTTPTRGRRGRGPR